MECLTNPHRDAAQGAGIQTAQLVADKGTKAVITGEVGPKAGQVLEAAGILMITGKSGSARVALDQLD